MAERRCETVGPSADPRVRLAAERTLLAWMRTGLALMGFGFVVARFSIFFHELHAAGHATADAPSAGWSVWIGTGLITLGVFVSLASAYEYYRFIRFLNRNQSYTPRTVMLAVVIAVLLAGLGIVMAVYLLLLS